LNELVALILQPFCIRRRFIGTSGVNNCRCDLREDRPQDTHCDYGYGDNDPEPKDIRRDEGRRLNHLKDPQTEEPQYEKEADQRYDGVSLLHGHDCLNVSTCFNMK
jgi:hypothetical protein